ncbi:tyrosine-type recombinase/integrase [Paenibacillus sp. NRS-1760]|uniref:tyrosine-type recombinase/integrase n=1 Tax=Paenibacillus sp. NRS-1760 TaxID=3233902 RepID=UPI003D2A0721
MTDQLLNHPLVSFFVADKRRNGTSEQSIKNNYVLKLRAFFGWLIKVYPCFEGSLLNNLLVASITKEHIQDYKSFLLRQVRSGEISPIGAKRSLQFIRTFFRVLYQKKRIRNDVAEFVTNIQADNYKYRTIPDDELLQEFFAAVDQYAVNPHLERLAFLLMLNVGLRASEVAKLGWRDINLSTKTIAINDTKGGNALLPLPDVIINHFLAFIEKEGRQTGSIRVFSQMKPSSLKTHLYQMFKIYWLVIGFDAEGGTHLLRHAYVTRLAKARCAPGLLMFLSRHESSHSLPLYLHASQEELKSDINRVGIY